MSGLGTATPGTRQPVQSMDVIQSGSQITELDSAAFCAYIILFWPKNIGPKAALKMLVKLTSYFIIFASPCDGYECQDFADCVDRSTVYDSMPTCVCQLGRWYDKVNYNLNR